MAAITEHWHAVGVVLVMMCGVICANKTIPTLTYTCPPKLQACDCTHNGQSQVPQQLSFRCPQDRTNLPLMYTLSYDLEISQLTMECTAKEIDYTLLKLEMFQFPKVDRFVLRTCPLPNGSIADVIDGLNITALKLVPSFEVDMLHSSLFQNLPQLEHLDIEGGNIKVIENGSFNDLISLRSLKISQNSLSLFPSNIFDKMPSLISLNLDSNMIEELPPHAFENLPQLQNLSLNFNHIQNLSDGVFHNLVNLRSLMFNNELLDSLGANIFKNLTNLEFVDLSSTKLVELPEELFSDNQQLLTVLLKMNHGLSKLPPLLFQNAHSIQRLEMDQNNLTEVPPNLFLPLKNLSVLNLRKNRIETLPEGLFDHNTKLTEIDLSINQLTALPTNLFQAQTELKTVRLHNNKLPTVPREVFSSLRALDILDLSDNEIVKIDEHAFEDSNNITILDLSYNHLDFISDTLLIPSNIQYLNLSHNNLTFFPEHEWNAAPHILLINLTDNRIESVNGLQLMFKSKKVTVDMRRNEIKIVNLENMEKYFTPSIHKPDVPPMISIPTIYIEQNPINCDCNLLSFVRYLKQHISDRDAPFRFYANSLRCASPNDPKLLGRILSTLSDDELYCWVDELCDEHCICKRSSVSKTLTVDCRPGFNYTKLQNFPKTTPSNTTKLFLQNNNIASISGMKEREWRNLTEVNLSNNALRLDDTPFRLPDNLRLLELSNNSIEAMPKWLMTEVSFKDDLVLTLGGNPWRCDCTAVEFHQWLSKLPPGKLSDPSSIRCGNGSHVNEKFLQLRLSKFCIHHRAGPSGPILVTVFSALVLLGVAVIAGVLLTRNRHRIKMWCFRHKMCLWMRTPDDIEAGHPL